MFNTPYIILFILIFAMTLFIWGYWRYDVVAMLALGIAVAIGAVPFKNAFDGLTSPAVITVACVMIISQAISRSGSIAFLVGKIHQVSKYTSVYIGCIGLVTATLSAFMNNIGALGLMMPIAIQSAVNSKRSPAVILMPLALSSAFGGLITLIGTPPNLLISAYRQQFTGKQFAMFDFAYVGSVVAFFGILFITFVGWRLIPAKKRKPAKSAEDIFKIDDYIAEIKVNEDSVFLGETIAVLNKKIKSNFLLIAITRNKRRRASFSEDFVLEKNDILVIEATPQNLQEIVQQGKFELVGNENKGAELLRAHEISTMEAVVSPNSRLDGRSTKAFRLKNRFGIDLIAISRKGKPFRERVSDVILQGGDVLLLQGPEDNLIENASILGMLPLVKRNLTLGINKFSWIPIVIFILAITAAALQVMPVQIAFAAAILIMVLVRTIPARILYDGIEWPIIILLAAMIPVGKAMETTGGTALIATFILSVTPHINPIFVLAIMFILTMILTDFMNNAATAVVMAPIAVSIAKALHSNVDPFLMAVAIASSCAFLTPFGHQNNTIVMGPGGYKFTDYSRLGLPLAILVTITAVPMILWVWPI